MALGSGTLYKTGTKVPETGLYSCYSCACWLCSRAKTFRKGGRFTPCAGCKKSAEWRLKQATTGKNASRRGILDLFAVFAGFVVLGLPASSQVQTKPQSTPPAVQKAPAPATSHSSPTANNPPPRIATRPVTPSAGNGPTNGTYRSPVNIDTKRATTNSGPAGGTGHTPRTSVASPNSVTKPTTLYTPRASSGTSSASSSATRPATTYMPRSPGTTGASPRATGTTSINGAVTYTPRSSSSTSNTRGITTSNGVTTYTPHSGGASGAGNNPAVAANRRDGASSSTDDSTFSPKSPSATGTVYTPPAPTAVASRSSKGSVLTQTGSRAVVQQVNSGRTAMKGINGKPLPSGSVTVQGNGNLVLHTADGTVYGVRKNGTLASYATAGRSVGFRSNGRISSVHTASMDIRWGSHGERTVVSSRPDHSILVSTGTRRGYLERKMASGNRNFIQRSYFVNGQTENRIYTTYKYRGAVLPSYIPAAYYTPAFYGWAFYPWTSPTSYAWGAAPWMGFYGSYFTPDGVYPSGVAWLTDYVLSQTLADAYAQQMDGGDAAPDTAVADGDQLAVDQEIPTDQSDSITAQVDSPITPELKAAIAEEIQRQLAYENAIASGTAQPTVAELPPALKPDRIFLVTSSLDVTTIDQQACSLSAGEVLRLSNSLPYDSDDSNVAGLRVASSRRADCPAGVEVSLSLQDLADMQNALRAQMDAGLEALRDGQGQNGLPAVPTAIVALPPRRATPDAPPVGDQNIAALLNGQRKEARHTETSVLQTVASSQHRQER